MTHFGDSLFLGPAATEVGAGFFSDGGLGFGPIGRVYVVDMVPVALNASGYAASQSPGASPLRLSAGAGITAIVDAYGITRYTADVPRGVTITSGGNDSGITFLIRGYDQYNSPMSQTVTGANVGTVTTTKTFKSVISITPSAAVASTVTAGTADLFGMPVAVLDRGYIGNIGWANILADNGGTFTTADQTNPATSLTGDVRGTYAQTGAASNGSNRLVIEILLSEANIGLQQTIVGVLGQPQA
jgi:hypothetical protein